MSDDGPNRRRHVERKSGSSYSPHERGEMSRLDRQAMLTRSFDLTMLQDALDGPVSEYLVLDVGCANGDVTKDRFGGRPGVAAVVGIDCDSACVETARGEHPDLAFEQVDIEAADAGARIREIVDTANVPNGTPVIASLLVVLHHLAAPICVLRTLRAVLPRGSRVIVRTIDEGSIMAYPDPQARVERVVGLGAEFPDGTDRFHGRKLHHQLYRSGFRDSRLFVRPYVLTATDLDPREFFEIEFGFRQTLCRRGLERAGRIGAEGDAILEGLSVDIGEIELDFEDPAYTYVMCWFGAVGRV